MSDGAWPGGARCAVAFTFDFDAESVWIGDDPENERRPGVLSMGTYGAKVAVPLILDLLKRRDVRATFFVPGVVAERYHERVEAIVAAGHELAVHGYTHRSPARLSRDEEEEELTKARSILEAFGSEISGYRSPSWDFSPHTLDLLEQHGFAYSSNFMDDLRPYRHEGRSLVELPVQWILDDAAHWWFGPAEWTKKISTTAEVRAIWEEELDGIRSLGGSCVFTMHPQVVGRPSRLAFLERFVEHVQRLDDVW
ncbi:MAG: polysaccharide deacetylase, partial [Actinomycetota bacterium]|nr:polysaccharide deacetylase [Actinomycetota bacterium]